MTSVAPAAAEPRELGTRRLRAGLRRGALAGGLGVVIEAALGMGVNLYTTIPGHHPGSQPGEYFSGSFQSVTWALVHGPPMLILHVVVGLALGLMVAGVAVRALLARAGWAAVALVLGALLVLGAGFNGASFLDFKGQALSSLIMALLALGAITCYLVAGFLLSER